ncbi:MAG: C40 family peptidase, partial [Cyanobacteria bacterium P01_H01_bin.130]
GLTTQAAAGRFLWELERSPGTDSTNSVSTNSVKMQLLEDGYCGWMSGEDWQRLTPVEKDYAPATVTRAEIVGKIPGAIAFMHQAMAIPNRYLWGGTVAPDYDCSGLMQAAFAAMGVWLPRDSYQQEAWTLRVSREELEPGDLIFFSKQPQGKIDHVALFLGDDQYIHSSGYDQGRGGIAIDTLNPDGLEQSGDAIAQTYASQVRSFGRIVKSYQPDL